MEFQDLKRLDFFIAKRDFGEAEFMKVSEVEANVLNLRTGHALKVDGMVLSLIVKW